MQNEEKPNLFAYFVDVINEKGEIETCKFIYECDLNAVGKKSVFKVEHVGYKSAS